MGDCRDTLDQTPPVLLREPQPGTMTEDDAPLHRLHPGWAAFLAQGEVPLWHGKATVGRPSLWPTITGPALIPSAIGIGLVAHHVGLWPAALLAALLLPATAVIKHDWGLHAPRDWNHYLLTGRTAYIARVEAEQLQLVRRIPINRSLGIELGATNVRFRPGEGGWQHQWFSPRNPLYERFDDGFFGIPDAENVYEIMRAIQKGQP